LMPLANQRKSPRCGPPATSSSASSGTRP
jgi:hypothetical protein